MHKFNEIEGPNATFFHTADGLTIAMCKTSGGQVIKAYAKCSPEDKYSAERGEEIAYARLSAKYLKRRIAFQKRRDQDLKASLEDARRKREEAYVAYQKAKADQKFLEEKRKKKFILINRLELAYKEVSDKLEY